MRMLIGFVKWGKYACAEVVINLSLRACVSIQHKPSLLVTAMGHPNTANKACQLFVYINLYKRISVHSLYPCPLYIIITYRN